MLEPPIPDFGAACSQMHDHGPIRCAPEQLCSIVLHALDAAAERTRREAGYQATGRVTFPDAA